MFDLAVREDEWGAADTLIRRESGGKRSLDYYCRLF